MVKADVRCSLAGIGYSDDKLLQSRIFSYPDTQRYRLGANYLMLPWNAPKCPSHNNHHEGAMNFMHRDEEVRSGMNLVAMLFTMPTYMGLWHLPASTTQVFPCCQAAL